MSSNTALRLATSLAETARTTSDKRLRESQISMAKISLSQINPEQLNPIDKTKYEYIQTLLQSKPFFSELSGWLGQSDKCSDGMVGLVGLLAYPVLLGSLGSFVGVVIAQKVAKTRKVNDPLVLKSVVGGFVGGCFVGARLWRARCGSAA